MPLRRAGTPVKQASWAPALQRTAQRRATRCAASGERGNVTEASPWRQHHHHLAALEAGVLLDLGVVGDVGLDAIEQLGADFLMRHFAAAVAQGDLDLVA